MTLRIGVLGAANISRKALFAPVADTDGIEVVAIAARDRSRAEAQAREHGIRDVLDSYEAVLNHPAVDVVYNPLPINLHHTWNMAALRAGKDVLSEKPFAANAALAQATLDVAAETGRRCVEAYHWRYHPMAAAIGDVLKQGTLGEITNIDAAFTVEIRPEDDVRHSYDLAGGALMDLGCYPVQWVRFVGGEPEVTSASMTEGRQYSDIDTHIELLCPGGVAATIHTGMAPGIERSIWLRVTGSDGEMNVTNPLAPHQGNRLLVTRGDDVVTDVQIEGRATYNYQLEAFADALETGAALPTEGADSVNTMKVIDAAYTAAGLPLRQG